MFGRLRTITPAVFAERYAAATTEKLEMRIRQLERVTTTIAALKAKIPSYEAYQKLCERRKTTANNRQKRLVVLEAKRRSLAEEVATLTEENGAAIEEAYTAIFQVPRVDRVGMRDGKIVVITKTLYGKRVYGPRTWHRLGRFEITIDPKNILKLRWTNLDHPDGLSCIAMARYIAPQITVGGYRDCLGWTAHDALVSANNKRNLAGIIAIVIRFTECPGTSTAYNDVLGYFPKVSTERVPAWYIENFGR